MECLESKGSNRSSIPFSKPFKRLKSAEELSWTNDALLPEPELDGPSVRLGLSDSSAHQSGSTVRDVCHRQLFCADRNSKIHTELSYFQHSEAFFSFLCTIQRLSCHIKAVCNKGLPARMLWAHCLLQQCALRLTNEDPALTLFCRPGLTVFIWTALPNQLLLTFDLWVLILWARYNYIMSRWWCRWCNIDQVSNNAAKIANFIRHLQTLLHGRFILEYLSSLWGTPDEVEYRMLYSQTTQAAGSLRVTIMNKEHWWCVDRECPTLIDYI